MVKRKKPNTHNQALGDELENPATHGVRVWPRGGKKTKQDVEDAEEEALNADASEAVLRVAREQQAELDAEGRAGHAAGGLLRGQALGTTAASRYDDSDASEDDMDGGGGYDEGWMSEEEEEVSPEDEAALAAFAAPDEARREARSLSDIILEKIRAKEAAQRCGGGAGPLAPVPEDDDAGRAPGGLPPKVVEVYEAVGKIMGRYSAGKVPKAFKIIPTLKNWEEVLYLTDPQAWSPHATYQATRLFVSSLNARLAQRFVALVLLPAVREDIKEHRRLHFALFQALKKAAYKPDAFYKGFLLPLCASGTCTLREAVIVSSVLRRVSLPVLHSAAALARLASMAYSGVNSFFIRVLLDKKYALPYRVVDALVDHFLSFRKEQRALPVVWHQSLLCFVQRYKNEIRAEDKAALGKLLRHQYHYAVTPEVHRELEASRSRGEKGKAGGSEVQARVSSKVMENIRDLPAVLMMDED